MPCWPDLPWRVDFAPLEEQVAQKFQGGGRRHMAQAYLPGTAEYMALWFDLCVQEESETSPYG